MKRPFEDITNVASCSGIENSNSKKKVTQESLETNDIENSNVVKRESVILLEAGEPSSDDEIYLNEIVKLQKILKLVITDVLYK